jgi:hypothetical protein
MRRFLLLMVFLFCMAEVSALQGYVDQPTTVVTSCIRNGQLRDGLNVTIIVYWPNGTVLVPATLETPLGNGTYGYTYTFTKDGTYSTRETCDFNGTLADGSSQIDIVHLMFGSVQVLAQSIGEVYINRTVNSDWLFILPNQTGAENGSSVQVSGGYCAVINVSSLNETLLDSILNASAMTVGFDASSLKVSFNANTDYGFTETNNYEIVCNVNMSDGMHVNGLRNYFYVNPHQTYLQWLGSIITSIAQLLGIVQANQVYINQTFNMTNQTWSLLAAINASGITSTGGGANVTIEVLT